MNYKSLVFFVISFLIGLFVGKAVKINIKRGGCPIAQKRLEELRRQLNSDKSEDYL
jgi:hypothetical protein